jgi:hypothetical protein
MAACPQLTGRAYRYNPGADDFHGHLSQHRRYEVARSNPQYADVQRDELTRHVNAVVRWINSDNGYDREAMAQAMKYFGTRYHATGKVYRGTAQLVFDGRPASYTKQQDIAVGFAVASAKSGHNFFVIERKAPANSLDLSKLLKQYATCSLERCDEAEVIVFNTPVPDKHITEYER